MALPLFYHDEDFVSHSQIRLGEETARHVVQVLRRQEGDKLELTNGKGVSATATIVLAEKKKLEVLIEELTQHELPPAGLHLCVAFTKNAGRNEWLLEKATEMGARSIVPVIASRSERERIRYDRWTNIMVAALIQSQQYYLPKLSEAMTLPDILQRFNGTPQKLVGHCIEGFSRRPLSEVCQKGMETVALIGPEGDFTAEEVEACYSEGFTGISLVYQRLRTETAAMAVCAYFNLINHDV